MSPIEATKGPRGAPKSRTISPNLVAIPPQLQPEASHSKESRQTLDRPNQQLRGHHDARGFGIAAIPPPESPLPSPLPLPLLVNFHMYDEATR